MNRNMFGMKIDHKGLEVRVCSHEQSPSNWMDSCLQTEENSMSMYETCYICIQSIMIQLQHTSNFRAFGGWTKSGVGDFPHGKTAVPGPFRSPSVPRQSRPLQRALAVGSAGGARSPDRRTARGSWCGERPTWVGCGTHHRSMGLVYIRSGFRMFQRSGGIYQELPSEVSIF